MGKKLDAILKRARENASKLVKTKLAETVTRKSASGTDDEETRPMSIAKYIRGGVTGMWDEADVEKSAFVRVNKALGELQGMTGGFLIPEELVGELIPYQYAQEVVSGMPGVKKYNIKGDTLEFNRQKDIATANWVGESEAATESTTTDMLERVLLRPKKVVGLVKVANELLDDAGIAADTFIKDDLTKVLALKRDLAFLEGTGGGQPTGIYRHAHVLSTDLSRAGTFDDVLDAMYQVESNNGVVTGWVANPIIKSQLRQLKDGNGNYIYKEITTSGEGNISVMESLYGLPIKFTNQIPRTGRPDTNESYLIGGNWSEFAIASKGTIRLEVSREADTAFAADQTWIKAVERCDSAPLQPKQFVVIKGWSTA